MCPTMPRLVHRLRHNESTRSAFVLARGLLYYLCARLPLRSSIEPVEAFLSLLCVKSLPEPSKKMEPCFWESKLLDMANKKFTYLCTCISSCFGSNLVDTTTLSEFFLSSITPNVSWDNRIQKHSNCRNIMVTHVVLEQCKSCRRFSK